MKLYSKCLLTLTVCTLLFGSCKKYLDIKPKGVKVLTTTIDYDQWLNSPDLMVEPAQLNLFGDQTDNPTIPNPPVAIAHRAYIWSEQFDVVATNPAIIWPVHYKSIYYYNTVILGVDEANGPADKKASLKAEALLGRALEYLFLVNEYGKLYNSQTASTDLAVPLVVSNDLDKPLPNRSTVQQVYDQIISDLTTAIPNLPTDNSKYRCRGSVAAAYSVLARTYLFMKNYTEAKKYAEMALTNGNSPMVDYNTLASKTDMKLIAVRPDAIYGRTANNFSEFIIPQTTFLKLFSTGDLRLKFCYTINDPTFTARNSGNFNTFGESFLNWGTSSTEMNLIIAEVAARNNDLSTALAKLDIVRKARIATANYTAFSSTDAATVLKTIMIERQLEMGFAGMRWFDMRRLDAVGLMPTVTRLTGTGVVLATLAPGSPRYTLQIPVQEMVYHPDWIQNP